MFLASLNLFLALYYYNKPLSSFYQWFQEKYKINLSTILRFIFKYETTAINNIYCNI